MTRFLDSSAIVTAYASGSGVDRKRELLSGRIVVSRLAEVETVSGLVRLARENSLAQKSRDTAIANFLDDFALWHIIEVTREVTGRARELLQRHHLRAGDAIQLASGFALIASLPGAVATFVTFDRRLGQAARDEGLHVLPD